MTDERAFDWIGALLGAMVLLWLINAAAIWALDTPVVLCLAETMATDTVRGGYQVLGFMLALYLIVAGLLRGAQTVVPNAIWIFLFYLTPIWFTALFFGGGGCG